jgi:hypothetical protein
MVQFYRQLIPLPVVSWMRREAGAQHIFNPISYGGVMRKVFLGMCVVSCLAVAQAGFAQETGKGELREHARIAAAIRELHGAIEYMERAPHDFGGHKAQAIADSRKAIEQLRLAMQYRAAQDNKKGKK